MSPFKAVLEVTNVAFVTGKDENGTDLPLTRASYHRFDKDMNTGETGPDHNDSGSFLFVGSIEGEALLTLVRTEVDADIEISFATGEQGVAAA